MNFHQLRALEVVRPGPDSSTRFAPFVRVDEPVFRALVDAVESARVLRDHQMPAGPRSYVKHEVAFGHANLWVPKRQAEARVAQLRQALEAVLDLPRWLSIGSHENTAELRISRSTYEIARAALAVAADTETPEAAGTEQQT